MLNTPSRNMVEDKVKEIQKISKSTGAQYYEVVQAYEMTIRHIEVEQNEGIDWILRNIRDFFGEEIKNISRNIGGYESHPTISLDEEAQQSLNDLILAIKSMSKEEA